MASSPVAWRFLGGIISGRSDGRHRQSRRLSTSLKISKSCVCQSELRCNCAYIAAENVVSLLRSNVHISGIIDRSTQNPNDGILIQNTTLLLLYSPTYKTTVHSYLLSSRRRYTRQRAEQPKRAESLRQRQGNVFPHPSIRLSNPSMPTRKQSSPRSSYIVYYADHVVPLPKTGVLSPFLSDQETLEAEVETEHSVYHVRDFFCFVLFRSP